MKGLREFFIVLISIVVVCLISFITFVSTAKRGLEGQLVKVAIKSTIRSNVPGITEKQENEIDKILDYEGISDVVDTILEEYTKYMNGETNEINGETIDRLFDFIKEHETDIEKIVGEDIDFSGIDTPENREEVKRNLNEGLIELKNQGENGISFVVKLYSKMTSKEFFTKMILAICILIVIIGLLGWSLYKWMLPVGIIFIVSGIFTGILLFISSSTSTILEDITGVGFDLGNKFLLTCFLLELIGGIALVVGEVILNKKFTKKDNVDSSNNVEVLDN